ncbi:hypothetical protein A3A67_02715 [Candidatus Peribacteria bacterium RIFCSPLOWO2_01_FULL_51_18]|nr:MAG: hypothetical protein A3C52_02060 [Candidatus Peribacteria bacterium RIFCSPHIGHO2_02_FULL_51_15]OGJ66923.1 MAG: hypothetical protein A3A67_02715 [Candidatus Peribacteria bacterium RIFCSPLOWO2_01_FULL_51_18]OGJ68826.1 MAG: hypothetical protein A3J34_04150 [Candidatus Peribacteria bacterium RIFCSPLOWO2_02_FULL_51_10]
MGLLHSKKNGCSAGCILMKWLVMVLLFLATVAALIGTFTTHFMRLPSGLEMQFGSTGGSLAILAFVASVSVWVKHTIKLGQKCEVCNGR